MKPFAFTIHGFQGRTYYVEAYEPEPNSPFVVHRRIGGTDWCVTHRASTFHVVSPPKNTRKQGLEFALDLAVSCPLATEVSGDGAKLLGPVNEFKEQLKAAVERLTGREVYA